MFFSEPGTKAQNGYNVLPIVLNKGNLGRFVERARKRGGGGVIIFDEYRVLGFVAPEDAEVLKYRQMLADLPPPHMALQLHAQRLAAGINKDDETS